MILIEQVKQFYPAGISANASFLKNILKEYVQLLLFAVVLMAVAHYGGVARADVVTDLNVFSMAQQGSGSYGWTVGVTGTEASVSSSAVSAWRRALSAQETSDGGVRFPCLFRESGANRLFWDRPISLDLSEVHVLELELSCPRPDVVRTIGVYLKSGQGWYLWIVPLGEGVRHTLSFQVKKAAVEGRPAGWSRISGLRISFTSAAELDTNVDLYSLRARICDVALVEGSLSAPDASERNAARSAARRTGRWLDELGITYALLCDEDVATGRLARSRVAVLPYNPFPPESEIARLDAFARQGGRLMVFYSSSPSLARLMGVKLGEYTPESRPEQWSSFRFTADAPAHLPSVVFQDSRNIWPVTPLGRESRVIAHWRGAGEGDGQDPALVQTDRGFWMTHILLDGDDENKKRMLAGLLGYLDLSTWRAAAQSAMMGAGRVGGYGSFHGALVGLTRRAAGSRDEAAVSRLLTDGRRRFDDMSDAWMARRFPNVLDSAAALRQTMLEAYARVQRPVKGEFRGVWNHSGLGLYPGDWGRTCRLLADSGIGAVFPNVLWPGAAHCRSGVVPGSHIFKTYGDQLELCVEAARKSGIEVHAWKVCWNLGNNGSDEWVKSLEKEGRLQRSVKGTTLNWLCPSHPENVALELKAVADLVRRHKVHGVHLDYVRYPDSASCYCEGCRLRFERDIGKHVSGWPASAATGRFREEFSKWRARQITDFVRRVRSEMRQINPGVKLSVAVYSTYPVCARSVGQDWGLWLREGLVDFVVPMNYAQDMASFNEMLTRQAALPGSKDRIYTGIGVTASESRLAADQVIDQVAMARRLGLRGFVLFDLNPTLEQNILPVLRLGTTRKE